MQILDRESELAVLDGALADAVSGRGRVVLVTGEAGMGKTTLLRAFLDTLDPTMRVLRGSCEDLSVAEPLGALRDVLRDAGLTSPSGLTAGSLPTLYADLLSVCGSERMGTLLVVEDLHWADDATVDFVRFVSRRIADYPVCVAITARAEEAAQRQLIRRALGDVSADVVMRLPLAPLSRDAIDRLCAGTASDPERVHAASGGNAFFATELLRDQADQLPMSVRDAVLARFDRLDPVAQRVLQTVSAFPRRAEIEHVVAVLDGSADTEDGIDACLDAGLLQSGEDHLYFSHELARQAVMSSISAFRLRALNERLYQRLVDRADAGLSRLLHHARGAGNAEAVAQLAPRAAREAMEVGSYREASAFFSLAVESAGEDCPADLYQEAARALYLAGDHTDAAAYLRRAMAIWGDAIDPLERGRALRELGRYLWVRSDVDEALSVTREAIAVLEPESGPELAHAYSALSQLLMTGYRMNEVEEPANKAIALASASDRGDILSHALNNYGLSMAFSDHQRGRELVAESVRIGMTLDDPDHAARALANWMHLEHDPCFFKEALERAEISAAFSRDRELDAYYQYAVGMKGRALHQLGRWDEAAVCATQAFDPDDRVPRNYNFNGAMALFLHQLRSGEGVSPDVAGYLELFDHPNAEAQRLGPYAAGLVERAWLDGDGGPDAIARLERLVARQVPSETLHEPYVWLYRSGKLSGVPDMTHFPSARRLEMQGDASGAADAWKGKGASYEAALALAFGPPEGWEEALAIFESLGAAPAANRMRSQMGRTSTVRRGRPPAAGPHGLTDRQLDVLRLLDDGKTNAQIGEALFISPKTVDHHVSAILSKLDAASRGEAAAIARKNGLI